VDGDPDRSSLVSFVWLGTTDSDNGQPDVSAQEGGCSDRISLAHRWETSGPSETSRFLLDGALVGPHSAFEQVSCIDAGGDRDTEPAPGQRLGRCQLPPA
jgi:hypothetical protein